MFQALQELFDRRDLLYIIAWREIRIKYKQTVMGMAWAVLMPSVIVCAGFMVRFVFATVSGKPLEMSDLASVAVKAAPWAFFVSAIRFGTNSLVSNVNLITKIYLPRLVFPFAAVASQLFDFIISSAIVIIVLAIVGTELTVQLFWLPLIIGTLIVLAVALVVMLSAASLFFRDVKYIVEVFLTFAIFFTPVFYESSLLGHWAPLMLANPVSPLLEAIADTIVMQRSPSVLWLSYSVVCTVVISGIALMMFTKLDPYFAESI